MKPTLTTKLLSLGAFALLAIPSTTKADVQDRLYDFTDAYYRQNGINPAAIDGRRQPGPLAANDTPIYSFQRPVRALFAHAAAASNTTVAIRPFSNNHLRGGDEASKGQRDHGHRLLLPSRWRTKVLTRWAMAPDMTIPSTLLPVASMRAYPIPAPAPTARRTVSASEEVDSLLFG